MSLPPLATSLDGLWVQIQQAWDEQDIGIVNRLVDRTEKRRRDVAGARAGYTRSDRSEHVHIDLRHHSICVCRKTTLIQLLEAWERDVHPETPG